MADTKTTEKEPSIEEILESIRQIISEDGDKPGAPAPAPAPAPVAAAPPPPPPPPPPPAAVKREEVVLELTDRVNPYKSDLDLSAKTEPAMTDNSGSSLLSDAAATASAAAMAKLLEGNVAVERDEPGRVGNVTLEDMARELMRPLIKSWLDQNLPRVIEKLVQKEIEKVSRKAGG